MKNAEAIGALAGSIVGAVATGIAVYFTGNPLCALIGLVGYLAGSHIGKAIGK